MSEKMISPRDIYEHPEKFGGVLNSGRKSGNSEYASSVYRLMKKMYADFPEKLAVSMKGFILNTKDGKHGIFFGNDESNIADFCEIPDEIYDNIKKFF